MACNGHCSTIPVTMLFPFYDDQVGDNRHDLMNFTLFKLGNFTLSDLLFEPTDTVSHHRIWPYFFWITFTVGLIGNGLVIFVFLRNKQMRTVTNSYLINLAVSDVLYLLSTIPNKWVLMDHWPFGEFMCKLISYLMNVTMTVGILTLTVVGLDRHYALLYPISSRKHRTVKGAALLILICWTFSCAMNSPTFLIARKVELLEQDVCLYIWDELWGHKIYSVSMFILLYALPQLILLFCYGRIGHKMWCSVTADRESQGRFLRKLRNGRRVVKMVITVTVVFVICWFPVHLIEIMMAFGTDLNTAFHEFKLLAPMIPHICVVVNPFIYNFMSTTFHSQFIAAFMCKTISPKAIKSADEQNGHMFETLEIPLQDFGNSASVQASPVHLLPNIGTRQRNDQISGVFKDESSESQALSV